MLSAQLLVYVDPESQNPALLKSFFQATPSIHLAIWEMPYRTMWMQLPVIFESPYELQGYMQEMTTEKGNEEVRRVTRLINSISNSCIPANTNFYLKSETQMEAVNYWAFRNGLIVESSLEESVEDPDFDFSSIGGFACSFSSDGGALFIEPVEGKVLGNQDFEPLLIRIGLMGAIYWGSDGSVKLRDQAPEDFGFSSDRLPAGPRTFPAPGLDLEDEPV